MKRATFGNAILLALLILLACGLFSLHADELYWSDPGLLRWSGAATAILLWFGFTVWRWRAARADALPLSAYEASIVIAYASQTGTAEQWARQTAQSLQVASLPARLIELERLDPDAMRAAGRVLFVVSTTGEGDAPDSAAHFLQRWMREPVDLAGLQYGLLALGDSDYQDFCGFGRQLQHWLQSSAAQSLFDPVEVDNGDPAALRHWQHHLTLLSGASEMPDWQRPQYQRWQLCERRLLNPGSLGGPCFHLALRPFDGVADWQAGDLVEVGPRHAAEHVSEWLAQLSLDGDAMVHVEDTPRRLAELLACSHLPAADEVRGWPMARLLASLQPLPHREYSIASLPVDGALHLLVRQMRREDGRLGCGSGWLTMHAELGDDISLRIRSNPQFHPPTDAQPLILIGNGTGLAGLRALLKARISNGQRRHWLLFGERQSAHDHYYRDDIERWQLDGYIERMDLVWSREQAARIHVQQRLHEAADALRQWVADGAAIYVCGSLAGMAPGVDAVLREVLGAAQVEQLRSEGRYRRDVY
ncbi:sulfite reductase subunit alpha [Dyella tabacisoli]|nr:sulfite reductase flavoprotein subunit alpha [Dyella tabacisoli]